MPNSIGENHTKRKLAAGELVPFMGVNQMRTPNIAMIAASCGFDGVYRRIGCRLYSQRRPRRCQTDSGSAADLKSAAIQGRP